MGIFHGSVDFLKRPDLKQIQDAVASGKTYEMIMKEFRVGVTTLDKYFGHRSTHQKTSGEEKVVRGKRGKYFSEDYDIGYFPYPNLKSYKGLAANYSSEQKEKDEIISKIDELSDEQKEKLMIELNTFYDRDLNKTTLSFGINAKEFYTYYLHNLYYRKAQRFTGL